MWRRIRDWMLDCREKASRGMSAGQAYVSDEKGVAAIEFALILPVLLILFVGMIELTLRLSESRKTTLLAGMVGDLVSQNESGEISDAEIDDYYAAARYVLLPFDDSRILVRVASFSYDKDTDSIKRDWLINRGSLDENKCPEMTDSDLPSEMQDVITSGVSIIMTRVCRQQKTIFSTFLGLNFEKSPIYVRDSFFRPRYVQNIQCSTCS